MKKTLLLTVVLALSAVLVGCCGLGGNVQDRSYFAHKQRVCENGSCSTSLVEDEFVSDAPPVGYNYMNIGARIGRNGFVQVGSSNYNGYGGYNGYSNGYRGYNAYGYPVWVPTPARMRRW